MFGIYQDIYFSLEIFSSTDRISWMTHVDDSEHVLTL